MPRTHNLPSLKPLRRELRTFGTPAEAFLWRYLKNRQQGGLLFRRQFSVGTFILDFYCPDLRLALELDGDVHNHQADDDLRRTLLLAQTHAIRLLRYENHWVYDHLPQILDDIHHVHLTNHLPTYQALDGPLHQDFLRKLGLDVEEVIKSLPDTVRSLPS